MFLLYISNIGAKVIILLFDKIMLFNFNFESTLFDFLFTIIFP